MKLSYKGWFVFSQPHSAILQKVALSGFVVAASELLQAGDFGFHDDGLYLSLVDGLYL